MNTTDLNSGQRPVMHLILAILLTAMSTACAVIEPQVSAVIVNDQLAGQASTNVELERAGVRSPVAPGTTLEVGDIIRTGENATAVLLLENGAIEIFMLENTEVRISSIWMEIGEVYVKVKRKLRETFEIESEYGVAAVEGTVFAVRVGDASRSPVVYECTTLEGTVVVSSRDNSWRPMRVESGNAAVVNQGNAATSRTLTRNEFNDFIDRINKVERTYRPGSAELVAPDLVGLTHAEAQREASSRGIRVGNPVPIVTGRVAVGQIATQNPAAGGLMRSGASIGIEIEVAPATVPNVMGDTVETAKRKLASAKLETGRITEEPVLSGRFNRVMEQSEPAGAQVVPETEIDLVVAIEGATVPTLTGFDETTAKERIRNSGLVLGRVSRERGSGEPGEITDQDPERGEVAEKGSRVDIVIEEGCVVPRVFGDNESTAFQKIRSAGLTPRRGNGDGTNASDVNPKSGQRVNCSTPVTVDFYKSTIN